MFLYSLSQNLHLQSTSIAMYSGRDKQSSSQMSSSNSWKCIWNPLYFERCFSTGSTIRNWDKVNTWLDQMFWQIYQKLMLSSFLSSGNLCLIHHLKLFWPHDPEFQTKITEIFFYLIFSLKILLGYSQTLGPSLS